MNGSRHCFRNIHLDKIHLFIMSIAAKHPSHGSSLSLRIYGQIIIYHFLNNFVVDFIVFSLFTFSLAVQHHFVVSSGTADARSGDVH